MGSFSAPRLAKELISEKGDKTPITWMHRDDRFAEKLATPDVTVADLIGATGEYRAVSRSQKALQLPRQM